MPKVSIIIPLYNKAPYVEHCLETVASQSFTDWECIIVNDGSTDNSAELVESWLTKNPLYTLHFTLYTQPNSGVAAARNNGVVKSNGELICFLDADDWWEPTFLEKMVRFAEQNPAAGLWASNYIYYKPGKTRIGVTNLVYFASECSSSPLFPSSSHLPTGGTGWGQTSPSYINYPCSYLCGTGMPVTSISMMMRRSLFEELGGFPLGIRLGEDFLFWSKIALRYPVAFWDEPLAYYNNDVPASLRATRNLHAPEHHMLWHLDEIENFIENKEPSSIVQGPWPMATAADWRQLIDKLRVSGLHDYWLDSRYHDAAAEQLKKVDWSKQPESAAKFYHSPIWLLRTKRRIRQIGSYCKQKLIKLFH